MWRRLYLYFYMTFSKVNCVEDAQTKNTLENLIPAESGWLQKTSCFLWSVLEEGVWVGKCFWSQRSIFNSMDKKGRRSEMNKKSFCKPLWIRFSFSCWARWYTQITCSVTTINYIYTERRNMTFFFNGIQYSDIQCVLSAVDYLVAGYLGKKAFPFTLLWSCRFTFNHSKESFIFRRR